ncbi:hypothetical protein MLD38_026901 [Melastoma candidum]|uniref:Uncharacterized protein n=1 Tax=Melastoma candidum TaxID=119954 RepID=A0ACB9P377_9MYRT|nr:hypothetical protein MLD38_026901 [Melastoma candidum]
MDSEPTFIRVQERFSRMLTPRVRAALEYFYLFVAITLFCILVVMHANYVQQPGCPIEFSRAEALDAQLLLIKITSARLWSGNEMEYEKLAHGELTGGIIEVANGDSKGSPLLDANSWLDMIASAVGRDKLDFKVWRNENSILEDQSSTFSSNENFKSAPHESFTGTGQEEPRYKFSWSAKETLQAAIAHFGRKWYRRLLFMGKLVKQISGSFWKLWVSHCSSSFCIYVSYYTGVHIHLDVPRFLWMLHLDKLNSYAVQLIERRIKTFEPTYLYTKEKGYFLLPESAKSRHHIRTVNISISSRHSCFGNRWKQLLINRFVGYDAVLMNGLLNAPGPGYLYNYQTNEFFNLSFAQEPPEGLARFGDYFVMKCGVLMISLFVFFTSTMSVSFTLRGTQTRMLRFTVQLQHHARHRLPTFQLIFVHVIESLVFVPIMIGILFFLFEFYDDQFLAFMVLILIWLVRTPISTKFFPREERWGQRLVPRNELGFSYIALSTTAAFMQYLILYFWNRFEVPALQRFMQSRRSQLRLQPDFHITSSTILASTLHITRLNNRNAPARNANIATGPGIGVGPEAAAQTNPAQDNFGLQAWAETENSDQIGNRLRIPRLPNLRPAEVGGNSGAMNSFSSLLLWILGDASSEGLNSILSMFRDVRDQGQVYVAESPRHVDGGFPG